MTHVNNINNIMRDDKSNPSLDNSDAIKNCSDTFGQFIKVPKVLDKD